VTIPDALRAELTDIVGASHVLIDADVTEAYRTDWTGRWRQPATTVVRPGSTAEVAAVVRACAAARVSIVAQGGNTGLVGASIPQGDAVVVSTTRLNQVLEVDPVGRFITAQAGVTVATANAAAVAEGLAFGVDLASRDSATLGGIVATNAGGIRTIKYGATRAQLLGLEVVLADGTVVERLRPLTKDNVGLDLPGLFAGSEGTLGIVTTVMARLVTPPATTQVAWVDIDRPADGFVLLDALRRAGCAIEAAELVTEFGVQAVLAAGGARPATATRSPYAVLIEVSGQDAESALLAVLEEHSALVRDAAIDRGPARGLWALRERHTEVIGALSRHPVVKLDVSFPLRRYTEAIELLTEALASGPDGEQAIMFGHFGEGNLHVNVVHVHPDRVETVTAAALEIVAGVGGSVSAEHGIGRAKRDWVGRNRSAADVAVMRQIKVALDPAGLLNPGVLLDSTDRPDAG
jgi:FAD/FMN-containing dehydrogenase